MTNKINNEPSKEAPKLQIKESLCGIFTLGVIVAETIAAYVLFFSGHSLSLQVVSGVLVADAAMRATQKFMVIR